MNAVPYDFPGVLVHGHGMLHSFDEHVHHLYHGQLSMAGVLCMCLILSMYRLVLQNEQCGHVLNSVNFLVHICVPKNNNITNMTM